MQTHRPDETYLHLGTGPEITQIPVTADFWPSIDDRTELHTGRLMTGLAVDADWTVWERHPAGDEVIVVTDGAVRFHLDDGDSVEQLTVVAPEYIVVPTGVWHTADALDGDGRILVITWGEGTEHRPR